MFYAATARLVAVAAVLAATACAPVFSARDQAGLAPVTFAQPTPTVIGQR